MAISPKYHAIVCTHCRTAALIPDTAFGAGLPLCEICHGHTISVPGRAFSAKDLTLFAALERVVTSAELSRSEATLIAGELESVSARWEPPELVLAHIRPRLDGLGHLYDMKQEYSALILLVDMLLTVVSARMIADPLLSHRSVRPSGMRRITGEDLLSSTPWFPVKKARA